VFLTGAGGTGNLRVDVIVAGMSARNIAGTTTNATMVETPAGVQVRTAR
jgi:hypothetical protein